MERDVSDDDIRQFLVQNALRYPSQVSLMQAAVRRLWPDGAPEEGVERVVRLCLAHPAMVRPPLLPSIGQAGF